MAQIMTGKETTLGQILQRGNVISLDFRCGDFNTLLNPQERHRMEEVNFNAECELVELVATQNLADLESIGCKYTWSNKNEVPSRRVYSKIDGVLGDIP